jgi:hypothetical protein
MPVQCGGNQSWCHLRYLARRLEMLALHPCRDRSAFHKSHCRWGGDGTMSDPLCVQCKTRGRMVETSESARVDYYRCDQCGHVWSEHKSDPVDRLRSTRDGIVARIVRSFLGV